MRRRRRSSSPRPARAGTASAAAWAATSSASSCSATARRSRKRSARWRPRPASRSTSGRSARTPARARLRQVLDTAIAFYHAVLTGSKAGEPALAYLRGRGFTDATIETHQLGWAPAGWDLMARQLQAKRDVRPEELVEVGLASPSQRGRGVIDKFRARVLFPIRDQNGHAVGLGGRLLEGEGPEVPQLPGDAAVRQEPDALPHRQGQGSDPQERPGRHRRGLHRRADGPSGRLRERRRQPRARR